MAIGLIAGLTLLVENPDWKKRFSFLTAVGKMGLTNYNFQSIANVMFFRGLDDPDKVSPFWRVILCLFVFELMI